MRRTAWLVTLLLVGACDSDSATEPPDSSSDNAVAAIRLSASVLTLERGDTATLGASAETASGQPVPSPGLAWTTSAPSVATVEDGRLQAHANGLAIIRVTSGSASASATVTVVRPEVVQLEAEQDSVALVVGRTALLVLNALDRRGSDVADAPTDWRSLDETIASVSATGLVQGRAAGTTRAAVAVDGLSDTVTITVTQAPSGLSSADSSIVAEAIAVRAAAPVWPYPQVVQDAMTVMSNTDYGVEEWANFFRGEMMRTAWGWSLWDWIGYPVFFWQPEDRRAVLQEALDEVTWEEVVRIHAAHGPSLGADLAADPGLKEVLLLAIGFQNSLARFGVLPDQETSIRLRMEELIGAYPDVYEKRELQGADRELGATRLHAWIGAVESARRDGTGTGHIADLLELSGQYRDIFERWGILIVDNFGLDEAQLTAIDDFLGGLPTDFTDYTAITVRDHFDNFLQLPQSRDGSVNIFGVAVGAAPGFPFPADVAARTSDAFIEVLAHELTHLIDALEVGQNDTWLARKSALIERAGETDVNYLRSMVGGSYFQQNPQEFAASIGNQWFTDSEHTIRLGRVRFEGGYTEPLRQALWFADVMTAGGGTSHFFEHDTTGEIQMRQVPLSRNENGWVTRIELPDSVLTFGRDADGGVTTVAATAR